MRWLQLSSPFSDDCLSSMFDTESPTQLWTEIKKKYDIPAEEAIDAILTAYHLVPMRDDEAISNYADRVTSIEKGLTTVERFVKDKENFRPFCVYCAYGITLDIVRKFKRLPMRPFQCKLPRRPTEMLQQKIRSQRYSR